MQDQSAKLRGWWKCEWKDCNKIEIVPLELKIPCGTNIFLVVVSSGESKLTPVIVF